MLDPRPGWHFIVFFEERAIEGRYAELGATVGAEDPTLAGDAIGPTTP